ncbi:hypothetical protein [Pedobacter sp.]|uniref:hypothetical protein n=1 Tax=Pedobacter sp. TaxID=1411316 RepID=UPI003D7F6D45
MKKFFTILSLIVLTTLAMYNTSNAQNYKNAIGGRFGTANGVTFKTSLGGNKMIDIIANFRSHNDNDYFRLTGLYEIYNPIAGAQGLTWYYGIGGTIGSVNYKRYDNSDLYLSLDGVLGLDYKIPTAPINFSLDWKPAIELAPDTQFDGAGLGLSVRFTF